MDIRARRRRGAPGTLERIAPALLSIGAILVLGWLALWVGQRNLETAESDRLQSRIETVAILSQNIEDQLQPAEGAELARALGFDQDRPELAELLLSQFLQSDAPEAAALLRADGSTVAMVPPGTPLDVARFGAQWERALAGEPTVTDTFTHAGALAAASLLPVADGDSWGVVAVVKPAHDDATQGFHEQIGSFNGAPGGLVLVDRQGVAYNAWSRTLMGQRVLTAEERAPLVRGETRVWTSREDGVETINVATALAQDWVLLFEQATDDLFGDLRDGQATRDRVLVSLLAATIAGLAAVHVARERSARRGEARVSALLRNSQDLVLVVHDSRRLEFVSPSIEHLLGHPAEEWYGRDLDDLCHADDRRSLAELLDAGRGRVMNVRLWTAAGGVAWFDVEASSLRDVSDLDGVLLTCHEVGERKVLQDELSHQASHDPLTGLPNRAEFSHRLERHLAGAGPSEAFALLYIDLDRFKPVNDALGHDAGDRVLVTVAGRLRAIVDPHGTVARLGGDEFTALLPRADEPMARGLAAEILEAVKAPVAVGAGIAHLDASIGIAIAGPGTVLHSPEQLVRLADEAMYTAKHDGRGRYVVAHAGSVPPVDSASAVVDLGSAAHAAADASGSEPATEVSRRRVDEVEPPLGSNGRLPGQERSLSRRLLGAAPVLLSLVAVLAVAAVGQRHTVADQEAAEEERLAHQTHFVSRSAAFYSTLYDTAPLVRQASSTPWALDGSELDRALIQMWAESGSAGDGAAAMLLSVDGEVLASHPEGVARPVALDSEAWQEALAGHGNHVHRVDDPDEPRSYFIVPVVRHGETAAVVAIGFSLERGPGQAALAKGALAGDTDGGWSLLDADGQIYLSWNPDLIGEQLTSAEALVGLRGGETVDLSDDERVLVVSPMTSTIDPTYLAYSEPAATFFGDLRVGQTERDLAFFGLVVAGVVGLGWANHRRIRAVNRSEERLDALLQQAHDVLIVVDAAGRIEFMSAAVHRFFGDEASRFLGARLAGAVSPEHAERVVDLLTRVLIEGRASVQDLQVCGTDGRCHWFDVVAIDLRDRSEVGGILLTCHEVSERRDLHAELTRRARHDPLTGLPNRDTFTHALASLVDEPGTGPFAVLFVDLDHFKPVNDALGHDVGDIVLCEIADRFQRNVREQIGERPADLVCRLGGDEFAVLLRDVDEDDARRTADRLITVAAEPIPVAGRIVQVGATIGVAVSHPDHEDPHLAVRNADHAMYRAKAAGRGTYELVPSPL